jgi:hypothetical protein
VKHDGKEEDEGGLNREEKEPTADAEANRVLKVLMINFGASIR